MKTLSPNPVRAFQPTTSKLLAHTAMKSACFGLLNAVLLRETSKKQFPINKQTAMYYFTMSTLAAALLLFTRSSACAAGDNAEQDRAIAKIENLGGKVELDEKRPGKPVIKVDLRRTKVTDGDLEILKGFTHLRSLNLRSLLGVTDAGMKH